MVRFGLIRVRSRKIVLVVILVIISGLIGGLVIAGPSYVREERFGDVEILYGYSTGLVFQVDSDKSLKGFAVTIYAIDGSLCFHHIYSKASNDDTIRFKNLEWTRFILSEWSRLTEPGPQEQNMGVIVFFTIVTKDFEVYDFIRVIPINYNLLNREDIGARIIVNVRLDDMRPTEILDPNKLTPTKCEDAKNYIVLKSGKDGDICYFPKWQIGRYYLTKHQVKMPIILTRLGGDASKVENVNLSMELKRLDADHFGTLAAAGMDGEELKVVGFTHIWWLENRQFYPIEAHTFYNRRWSTENSSFLDEAVLALEVYGNIAIGSFVKYVEYGDKTPWSTGKEAIVLLEDILVQDWYGILWRIPTTFEVDDDPQDGEGFLDHYLGYLLRDSTNYHAASRWIKAPDNLEAMEIGWAGKDGCFYAGINLIGVFTYYYDLPEEFKRLKGTTLPIYIHSPDRFAFKAVAKLNIPYEPRWAYVGFSDFRYAYPLTFGRRAVTVPIYLFDFNLY